MNQIATLFFTALILTLSFAPNANTQQREYKSGLNYTTLGGGKTTTLNKPAEPAEPSEENEEEIDPATRVWNKYKDLATGTAETQEEEQTASIEKPEKPTVPDKPVTSAQEEADSVAKPDAFGSLLEQWQNSKKTQREMRSLSFKPAKAAENATEAE